MLYQLSYRRYMMCPPGLWTMGQNWYFYSAEVIPVLVCIV
jgi:hypothetical protein